MRNRKGVAFYVLAIVSVLLCFQLTRRRGSASCLTKPQGFGAEAIRCRIESARSQYHRRNQSSNPEEAIIEYKRRYRREPPKGFGDWVQFALNHESRIIDDYDQIDADLRPLRTPEARHLFEGLESRSDWYGLMRMESGEKKVDISGTEYGYITEWKALIAPFADYLPAGVYYLNTLDSPRVLASAEVFDEVSFHDHTGTSVKGLIEKSCHVDFYRSRAPFEQNDVCRVVHPEMSHGFVASPESFSYTHSLIPVMSIGRMSPFRDIHIPCPCYLMQHLPEEDTVPFVEKRPALYWRGSSTGLLSSKSSWRHGHRQRFVAFIRSLQDAAHLVEASRLIGAWIGKSVDMKQVELFKNLFDVGMGAFIQCVEPTVCEDQEHSLGSSTYDSADITLQYQFLYDLDGNSMSTRFYRLLAQRSVVFKQTLFEEWHDDRLVPWVHYIPVSLEMIELPEIMTYLIGTAEGKRHSEQIANAGYEWSRQVVRRIDLSIYMYRLMLEMAELFKPAERNS